MEQNEQVTVPVSPGFFGELWMSLVDTYDPEGDPTDGRRELVEALRGARAMRGKRTTLKLTTVAAEYLLRWLRDETDWTGRWADWGREGAPWIRAGRKMIERLEVQGVEG